MIERVVSGGQSGADLGGWKAAKAAGIPTGGWMVMDYWTEDGNHPEYSGLYGARLLSEVRPSWSFGKKLRLRARANVRDSDGTIVFDAAESKATDNARKDCREMGKPFRCVMLEFTPVGARPSVITHEPRDIAEWIAENGIKTLNVAGNRASKARGIEALVISYMTEVFRLIKERS